MATVGKKGKPGPCNRGTEAPQPSDSKRFKQEINPSQQSESGASAASSVDGSLRTRSPQHVASGILTRTATSAAATASILKAQKTKPPKERKDGCCLKSSSTSSQNLHDQASSGSSNPTPTRSPKSSIFTRFLHRQSHGAADGDGQKNSKGSKSDGQQSKSPKSPKGRLSDGRLKLFNRTSSIKEVKIALPASGKSSAAKSSGQHGASRSALRQPTIREKTSSKTKDSSRSKISFSLSSHQSHEKLSTEHSPDPSVTQLSCNEGKVDKPVKSNGIAAVSSNQDAAGGAHAQHGHIEDMDTSNSKDEVPKCRRESVQAWVNSISDERLDGVEDMEQQDAAASGSGVTMEVTHHDPTGAGHGVKADDDDLTLGAEAKLLTPGKDVTLSRSTKHRLAEVGASSGRNRQSAWREMFSSIKTDSFNSEGSAHTARTWDSIEQLLQERTGDPVEILTNLGFHSQESDESLPSRIPDRFLRQQSVASGISVEKFIESNPDLKEYVALTRSLSEPSTASLASGEKERRPSSRKPSTGGSMKSFASVVKTLTFMQRIAARMSWKEIDMTRKFLTPVDSATARHQSVRYSGVAPSGKSFTSILHPDNSQHLAEQGVYDDVNSRRASEVDYVARAASLNTRVPPSLDLSKIPGRFSPVPPAHDAKDTIPSPVPSPIASGRNSPNIALDRIPARFSSSTPPRESVITPPPSELLTPSMTNEKRGSLSVPGESRSRSASLWKRLSDAGRELEQVKIVETVRAQPRNIIDVSHPGRCPDLPLRFLVHSPESILNTSFHRSLDVEEGEMISTENQNVGDEGKAVQKKQENTGQEKVIHGPDSSREVITRPSVQVLLRQPTEDEDTPGDAKTEDGVQEYQTQRPTKLQKRRSDSLENTNKSENSDPIESQNNDGPSRKVRRKLGSTCKATDQAKLLRSLDLENQDTSTLETEPDKNEECTDGDSHILDFNDNTLHPRLSVASCGLADDEDDEESNKSLTRREKASKFLRKFLSQQEDEKAEESDSDGSVGDPAEPVEFGTAVMVKVIANRVMHKWRKQVTAPPEELPQEEQTTTDQGSVSGDDVGNIYGEGMDVDLDEVVPDSSAIDIAEPSIKEPMSDTDMVGPDLSDVNNPDLVRSDDTDTLSSASHKSEHVTFDCKSDSCLSPNVIMQESNETPRRRVTVCNATIQLELKKQIADLAAKGPRSSDSGINYESLLAVKRRRFSRQDNVIPRDFLINNNETLLKQNPEEKSEKIETYCQDMNVQNANDEADDVSDTPLNSMKAIEVSSTLDMSPDSDVLDENCNSTIALNTADDITISDAHHDQSVSDHLPSDVVSDFEEETELLLPPDKLILREEDSVHSVSLLQSEPRESIATDHADFPKDSIVLDDLGIGLSNRLLQPTSNVGTDHEISKDHHIIDEIDKTPEKQIICLSETSYSDKTIDAQQNEDALISMDLDSGETMKGDITNIQSSHAESEKDKGNQEIQYLGSLALLESTVRASSNDICETREMVKENIQGIESSHVEPEKTKYNGELPRPDGFALPESTFGASPDHICKTDETMDGDISTIHSGQHVCEKDKDIQEVQSPGTHALSEFTAGDEVRQDLDIWTFNETSKEDIPPIQGGQNGSDKANYDQEFQRPESLSPAELTVIDEPDNICEPYIPKVSFLQQEQSLVMQEEELVKQHMDASLYTTKVGDEDLILPKVSRLIESFEKDPDSGFVNIDMNYSTEIVPMIEENNICIMVPDVAIDVTSGDEVCPDIVCVPENSINSDKEGSNSCGSLVIGPFIENPLLSKEETAEFIREHSIVCETTPGLETVLVTKDHELAHDGTVDIETETQNDGSLSVQLKEPLIVSLGEDRSASSCSSDHGISEGYEELLLVANQARKMSFLRYTESDRDDSIRSETEETECIFQEHLIDDNVLDRSLSEQSYLVDLLDQLKQNKSIQSVKRSNSVGSIEHRLSSVFQPVELQQPAQKEKLIVTHTEDITVVDHVNSPDVSKDYDVDAFRSDPAKASCVLSIPNQQSFDLEEVSSEDFVGNSLPKVTKGGPVLQQPFLRAFSAQSDSSGFVEMEGTEIDWRELKIQGLGSSADSESSSRRSSHGAPAQKRSLRWDRQPFNMGTTAGKPLPYSDENKDATKSDDTADDAEESLWSIVENGHTVTQKDFLFGVPPRMKEKEASLRPRTRRRSRKQRPPPQWTSRLYIDPPTSPKVIPTSKMEVKFTIDKGQIQDIENAQVVPVDPPKAAGSGQRAVSYLCLSVSQDEGNFEITPVDKGNFSLPSLDMSKMDVSQHQVICSLLRRSSTAWKPDEETLRQFTLWNSTDATERRERNTHLIEEVKLIQHAITKFKIEFRVLDLRTNAIYNQRPETVTPQQRAELVDLSNLRSQIMQEITELERRLGERMRMILSTEGGMYTGDLSNLQVVQEVVEVLKEQVYHSSVIHGMSMPASSHGTQPETSTSEPDLVRQLSALQGHIEEHQNKTTTQLTSTMDQMRQTLLAEVRESVQKETEDLRKQVLDSQTEVRNLKEQLQSSRHVPSSSPEKSTEVRFPISTSPISQPLVNAPAVEVTSSHNNDGAVTEEQMEVQVSQRHRHEESLTERGFRPISKQDSDELEQM